MHLPRRRALTAGAVVLASVTALAGCASTSSSAGPDTSDLEIGSIDLAAAGCPETITIQTDWNPESEHGHLYQMVGENPEIDAENARVTGPLMAGGEYTGVNIQVRSGGPAIGFQTVTSQLYTDPDITLGYSSTDEAIQLSAELPTVGVFAPLEINPQMIMWDPETYPEVETIEQLADAGAVIRYFGGAAYMEYLMGAGIVPAEQADGSYDGTPATFVASGGADAQQGFASAEPYIYENEVSEWGKPVAFQLIHDAGFPIYAAALAVRADDLESMSGCLEELVPVFQQAEVDYFADPSETNDLIQTLVEEFDTGWVYSPGVAEYSVETMQELGLVGNGSNDTIGDFDLDRVQEVIDLVTPIFAGLDTPPADGITPDTLYTNEFIDESIGF